jgi:hypothetical protein
MSQFFIDNKENEVRTYRYIVQTDLIDWLIDWLLLNGKRQIVHAYPER